MAAASSQDTSHRPSAHLEPGSPVSLGSPVASGESDTESYHRRPQESDYPKPKGLYEDEDEGEYKGEDPLDIALEENYPSKIKSPPGIKRVLKGGVSRERSHKRSTPSTGRNTKRKKRKAPKRKSHSRRRNKKRRVRKAPKRKSHSRRRK